MPRKATSTLLALSLVVMVASVRGATYNGDLIVGFTDAVGNDLIYDLGAAGSITNGQKWNLASQLSSFTLANVSWGVVGTANLPLGRTIWITSVGGPPLAVPNNSAWTRINTAVGSMYILFPSAGPGQSISIGPLDQNSWNQQTINGGLFTQYHNVYQDPNGVGVTCAPFYSGVSSNLPLTLTGTFCLAANGVLTFTTPSTGPSAPTLQITRGGNVSTISFLGTNNVTYALHYTNTSGLTTPVSKWPSLPGTISGNNSVTNFTDTTVDASRVYRVLAQ
jgi:hypothetical protein